jgi:hypothetical protein
MSQKYWWKYPLNSLSKKQTLQLVGVGLCTVFELLRESRMVHPVLCTKALRALLDILQGQQPEGLKSEPNEVIGKIN